MCILLLIPATDQHNELLSSRLEIILYLVSEIFYIEM